MTQPVLAFLPGGIGPGEMIIFGIIALLLAILTVSYQAFKAAVADPVKSLRSE